MTEARRVDSILVRILLVVVLAACLFVIQSRNQSRSNGQMVRILVATSGCSIHDAPGECARHQSDKAKAEGRTRLAEVDCLTRRVMARLPAADPSRTCQEQTPPNVYPGGKP